MIPVDGSEILHQLRSSSLWMFMVFYIPGGDRWISETSPVVESSKDLTLWPPLVLEASAATVVVEPQVGPVVIAGFNGSQKQSGC